MNKGDALLLELDFTVNGESLKEGEWDDIELSLASKSYTLANGDIYWDGEHYVLFMTQEDSMKLSFTNVYQLRLLKDGFVISSKPMIMKVGGCLSRVILGDEYGESLNRYNPLIDGSIKKIVSNASTIRNYAFAFCKELETAKFTEATDVWTYAFWGCEKLKSVELDKCTKIHEYAFKPNVVSVLEKVDAPLCEEIGFSAFENSSIKELNAPNVDTISGHVFKNSSIEKIMFPKLYQNLGSDSFLNCANLKVIDIGLTDILENDAFEGCTSLHTIILRCPQVVEISSRTTMFDGSPFGADGTGGTIYVPNDLLETYTSDRSTRTTWQYIKGLNANNQILPIEGSIYE